MIYTPLPFTLPKFYKQDNIISNVRVLSKNSKNIRKHGLNSSLNIHYCHLANKTVKLSNITAIFIPFTERHL